MKRYTRAECEALEKAFRRHFFAPEVFKPEVAEQLCDEFARQQAAKQLGIDEVA